MIATLSSGVAAPLMLDRKHGILVANKSSQTIYLGDSDSIDADSGYPLEPGKVHNIRNPSMERAFALGAVYAYQESGGDVEIYYESSKRFPSNIKTIRELSSVLNLPLHSWWTAADLQGDYQTVSQGGTSSAPDAQLGSTSAADSNDPLYLDWQDNADTDPLYVYLDGASGSYISQPDSAGNSVTGDLDVRVRCAPDDIASAANQAFASCWSAGGNGNEAWILGVNGTGNLVLYLNAGFGYEAETSSTTTGTIDGEWKWFRATADFTTGEVKFWTSDDNITYTQNGNTKTTTRGAIDDITAGIEIGSINDGTNWECAGKFSEMQIRSGIDGPIVSHWRAQDMGDSGGPSPSISYDVTDSGVNYAYVTGTELVTNGTFDTDSDWTKFGSWTIADGVANATLENGSINQYNIITAGNYYHATFDCVSISTGYFDLRSSLYNSGQINSVGSYDRIMANTSTGLGIDGNNFTGSIDNVSIKQVAPITTDPWTLNGGYSVAKPSGNYVYLPGTAGNWISSPNPDLTGDQTWTWWGAADDWASGASQTLLGVYNPSGNNRSYYMFFNGSGNLNVTTSSDGINNVSDVTGLFNVVNGEYVGIQGRYDASAGTVEIYRSVDGQNWTSIDTLTGLDTSLFSSNTDLTLGMWGNGGNYPFAGKIGWVTIHDNATYTGDPVWRFDAGSSLMTQTGYTDPYSGDALAIHRSASGLKSTLVTRPVFVLNSAASTYLEIAHHADINFEANDDFTVWFYGRQHGTNAAYGFLINKINSAGGYQIQYSNDTMLVSGRIDDGPSVYNTNTSTVLDGELSLISFSRKDEEIAGGINETLTAYTSASSGDLTGNALPLRVGGSSIYYNDMEVWAWGVVKGTALTASQLAQLKRELDTRLQGTIGE